MKKLIVLLVFLPLFLFAQDKGDTLVSKQCFTDLQNRVTELEKKIEEGNSVIKKSNETYDSAKNYSDNADLLVKYFMIFFTVAISLASLTGFFGVKGYIRNRMTSILHQKEEVIKELFLKHEVEKGLISKSQILIINKKDTSLNEYLEKVLKKFSKNVKQVDIPDLLTYKLEIDFKDFDLVLFDNTNTKKTELNWDFEHYYPKKDDDEAAIKKLDQKNNINDPLKRKLVEIVKEVCSNNTAFLFFGKNDGHFTDNLPEYSHLINFSNYPATAYQNIINLLSFRRLLKES